MQSPTPPDATAAYSQPARPAKFPVGLILVIIFVGLGILGSINSVFKPAAAIGSIILTGILGYAYNVAQLAIEIVVFVGLIKRKEWGRVLGIWYYGYSIAVAALMSLTFAFNRPAAMRAFEAIEPEMATKVPEAFLAGIVYIGMAIAVILCAIVVAYLAAKKQHFRP